MAPAAPRLRILSGTSSDPPSHDNGPLARAARCNLAARRGLCKTKLTFLSVGGNAVSAFLSWRLQATNACDVTLVWKSGYEGVAQYGISFKYVAPAPNDNMRAATDWHVQIFPLRQ